MRGPDAENVCYERCNGAAQEVTIHPMIHLRSVQRRHALPFGKTFHQSISQVGARIKEKVTVLVILLVP